MPEAKGKRGEQAGRQTDRGGERERERERDTQTGRLEIEFPMLTLACKDDSIDWDLEQIAILALNFAHGSLKISKPTRSQL